MQTRLGLISAYSFLYGVHKPEKLLDQAALYGIKTVSLCDINNLYGVHSFLENAKERNIRPIIGTALTNGKSTTAAVYCFVENRAGFGRLCEILTIRNKDKGHFDPLPLLRENASGLVLASTDASTLEYLCGHARHLYAAITPTDIKAINTSRRLNIPPAFLDDSLFLEPGDFAVHKVLRAIGLLKTIGNLTEEDTAEKNRVLRPAKELHRQLTSWPEAVKGTGQIASICRFDDLFDSWIFPGYGENPAEELRRRVNEGAELRYGKLRDKEPEKELERIEYEKRIEYELGIIGQKGFAPYFLVIDDIVKMASRTCGRGSGAASIVSYALGITNVEPLRHNLYFERFLNPARPDPPDLDIDFAWDERDELIKAVIEKFGPDHCARVANHNMFRYRSALRETAKAYGFGDAEISGIERKLQLRNDDPEIKQDSLWKEIFSIAVRIEGLPCGLGMHCGGLVITPEPISRYVPVEKSAEGYPLLVWEKEGTEAAGFVKIDLLGNRSLAVIRDTLKNLEEHGIIIDPRSWRPIDDKPTIDALARGDSIGVFYIESPAMRQLQKKTNAGDFDHIVIHSSIIRPAANKYISEYVRRLKGAAWEPLHPLLDKILDESYGILCYQEDVSKAAVALAGFNEVDADKLRKVIAKKMGGTKLAAYQNQFYDGCRENNVCEETIRKIWEMMLSFDGYSFCKPHSASYAMVSFQSAYLRVHHPAEFMAAVLSNQGGYYRPHAYIAEVRRMGLFTVGPDINASRWRYYGKGRDVVIGLMAIKGLSASGAEAILEERDKGGEFKNLEDFSRRVRLNRDDIIALCPAGVFDRIAGGLPRSLQARRLLGMRSEETGSRNGELFADGQPVAENVNKLIPNSSFLTPNCLWEEYRALGFLRRLHPLALWKDDVMAVKYRTKALRIGDYVGRNVKMIGWPVTQKDVWTKDGLAMSFLSLEDETALYETVIFPDVYDKYNKLLFDQRPLLVYGRVTDDQGAVTLEVSRIEALGDINRDTSIPAICQAIQA
jgi:DNA polymerase-3 subunit alpha/error-prone DNA polymerase